MAKQVVTISRYWHNPQIMTVVWGDGISLTVDLNDFKKILRTEIGSVRYVIKDSTFDSIFDKAFSNALAKIKEESLKVI